MASLENKIISSARSEADGSGSSTMGAQLIAKLSSGGKADPTLKTEVIKQELGLSVPEEQVTPAQENIISGEKRPEGKQRNHEGNKRKGNPDEIKRAINKAAQEGSTGTPNFNELQKEKDNLLLKIADETIKRKQVAEKNLSEEAAAFLNDITRAQKRISEINKILPNSTPANDDAKINEIISKWNSEQEAKVNTSKNEQLSTMSENIQVQNENSETEGAKSWQDEAIKKWETEEGNKVPSFELEPKPIPEANTTKEWTMDETLFPSIKVTQEEIPVEKFEVSPEATLNLNSEQEALVKKLEENINDLNSTTAERAEKAEVPLEATKNIFTWYNKLPWYTKVGLSASMIATGVVVGAAAVPGIITGGVIMRTLGGGGMIYALKEKFDNLAKVKNAGELTKNAELLSTVSAIAISGFVAACLPSLIRDYTLHSIVEKAGAIYDFYNPVTHPNANAIASSMVHAGEGAAHTTAFEHVATAAKGDTRWSLIAKALHDNPTYKDQFQKLGIEKQTYVIDTLKHQLTAGMTDAQANTLNVGDKVDLSKIFANKELVDHAFSKATGLTHDQITHIHNFKWEAPTSNHVPTNTEFNKYEVPYNAHPISEAATASSTQLGALDHIPQTVAHDSVVPPVENIHSADTLLGTTHIEGGKDVPIIEHHVPTETVHTAPAGTHAVALEQQVNQNLLTAYTDKNVHDTVDKLFGSKGFFGFGAEDGMKNANWLDFANRPIDEIISTHQHRTIPGYYLKEAMNYGINSNDAVNKMHTAINDMVIKTGVPYEKGETVEHFFRRAMEHTFKPAANPVSIIDIPVPKDTESKGF